VQVLDQQPLGAFHGDWQPCPELAELLVELGQAGDVMG
jgi:hypothetical protein